MRASLILARAHLWKRLRCRPFKSKFDTYNPCFRILTVLMFGAVYEEMGGR